MDSQLKIAWEDPDTKLYQVDGKWITEKQLEILEDAYPDVRWIIAIWDNTMMPPSNEISGEHK